MTITLTPEQAIIQGFMEQLELLDNAKRIEVLIKVHKELVKLAIQTGKEIQVPLPFSDYNLEEVYSHFMEKMSDTTKSYLIEDTSLYDPFDDPLA